MTKVLLDEPIHRVGGYSLHLYCKYESDDHHFDEFPHELYDYLKKDVDASVRRRGWIMHRDGTSTCPKCAKK